MLPKLLVLGGVVAFFMAVLRARSEQSRTARRVTVLHVVPVPVLYALAVWGFLGVAFGLFRPGGVDWLGACLNGLFGVALLWFARGRAREEPGG